ncbi:MAG: hypothetical protein MJY57_02320, partial [Bacteroidales bacterium]|nr:hypothetical protein [Bacteroidales bacterium]
KMRAINVIFAIIKNNDYYEQKSASSGLSGLSSTPITIGFDTHHPAGQGQGGRTDIENDP